MPQKRDHRARTTERSTGVEEAKESNWGFLFLGSLMQAWEEEEEPGTEAKEVKSMGNGGCLGQRQTEGERHMHSVEGHVQNPTEGNRQKKCAAQ